MSVGDRDRGEWVALEMAPDQIQAEMMRDVLLESGIPAMIGQGDTNSFMGISLNPVRVMVYSGDLERAQKTLEELTDPGKSQ